MSTFSRLIRFRTATEPSLIGEPVNKEQDVGKATVSGEKVEVELFSGSSILNPGEKTGKKVTVERLLCPLKQEEVGTIRCIGINYAHHAKEVNMEIPTVPTLFMKPQTAMTGPFPDKVVLPKAFAKDNAADYESELAIIIGKECKDVTEEEAGDYILGYTAANDISSRVQQFAQSQWSFSKSFDTACPVGPAVIPHSSVAKKLGGLKIRGILNGKVVQESNLDDLIFSIPKIVSFLSQDTTLLPGTLILTGTPAGVGWTAEPRRTLQDGDEFRVEVSHGVGSLVNQIVQKQ